MLDIQEMPFLATPYPNWLLQGCKPGPGSRYKVGQPCVGYEEATLGFVVYCSDSLARNRVDATLNAHKERSLILLFLPT
jgi:hypothetical protein